MNAGGLAVAILGAWVITQIWGGNALERLRVIPS